MFKRILLLCILFGSLALGFYVWNESETTLNSGISVKGVYHEGRECNGGNCSSNPFVTFTTEKGKAVTFYPFQSDLSHQQFLTAFYEESNYHDGQSMPVIYNPAHPSQAFLSTPIHIWMDAVFWWALGACMLLSLLIRGVRQDQKKVIRR